MYVLINKNENIIYIIPTKNGAHCFNPQSARHNSCVLLPLRISGVTFNCAFDKLEGENTLSCLGKKPAPIFINIIINNYKLKIINYIIIFHIY